MIDACFAHESVSVDDCELYLNGFPPDHQHYSGDHEELTVVRFDDKTTIAHLMAQAGIFKSVSDAKRNGWFRPVPDGYSQFVVGKARNKITVLGRMIDA